MLKYKRFTLPKVYQESGLSASFSLPDDCTKIRGVFILPELPALDVPNGKPFLIGELSVLINNKEENSIHDYFVMCYPDKAGKMSLGDDYVYYNKAIELNTKVKRGYVISFIFKDSGEMFEHIQADNAKYGTYNPDIHVYICYEDLDGDETNNTNQEIKFLISKP